MTADLTAATTSDAAVTGASVVEPAEFAVLFDRHAAVIRDYLARRVGRSRRRTSPARRSWSPSASATGMTGSSRTRCPGCTASRPTLVRQRRRTEVRQLRALARTGVDIPLGTVRSRLSRARAKVRAALEEHPDD